MTLSFTIDHTVASVEDVSVEVAAKSELTRSSQINRADGTVGTVYYLASGDNSFPATVTYESQVQKRQAGQVRRLAITFRTWAVETDSVSGLDRRVPISAQLSFLIPADMTIEVADLNVLLGNMFSFAYSGVSSKLRNTAWLQKLLYGVSDLNL
jgi:hypothetical protein